MKDEKKTKRMLIEELQSLRCRVRELEGSGEDALRALKDFNDNVIQSIPSGLVAHDLEMRITLWNKAMEEVSGYRAEEVLGKDPYEIFPHLREEGLDKFHQAALEGSVVSRTNVPYRTPKGKSGFTNETCFPLRDADGAVVGVMGIVEDVTEIVRLEKEVGRLHQEVEQRKLVEVAKGILMREIGLSEAESYILIQKRSRNEGAKMVDVARLVISLHGTADEREKFI